MRTFTKKQVEFLLVAGVVGAFAPYVLSAFGREPVEAIGLAWITEIVAVILGYYLKSYSETKQEKEQELKEYIAKKGDGKEGDDE